MPLQGAGPNGEPRAHLAHWYAQGQKRALFASAGPDGVRRAHRRAARFAALECPPSFVPDTAVAEAQTSSLAFHYAMWAVAEGCSLRWPLKAVVVRYSVAWHAARSVRPVRLKERMARDTGWGRPLRAALTGWASDA